MVIDCFDRTTFDDMDTKSQVRRVIVHLKYSRHYHMDVEHSNDNSYLTNAVLDEDDIDDDN